MKTQRTLGIRPAIAGLVIVLTALWLGAAQQRQPAGHAGGSAGAAGVSGAEITPDLRNCPFEERGGFLGVFTVKHARLSASIDRMRSRDTGALASEKKKAAMSELATAESNFEQKLGEAESATAETWNAARDNVAASWDSLHSAYTKAVDAR